MKKLILAVIYLILSVGLFAQVQNDTTKTETAPPPLPPKAYDSAPSKVYYGGNIGFNFGNYTRISVEPLVAYKITPQLSGGVKLRYEWIKDKRYEPTLTTSNYGGSLFARYRVIPQLYFHAEYSTINYEYYSPIIGNLTNTEREWVPFLLLGGGYTQRISSNIWAYAEVLFDVLQDDRSPYKDWEPFISIGAGVGF